MTAYPILMAYIASRQDAHFRQLHVDEAEARDGGFAEVAAELKQAEAEYWVAHPPAPRNDPPDVIVISIGGRTIYNRDLAEFLGLEINNAGENHGLYFARCLLSHHTFGEAKRTVETAIAEGRELRVPLARNKQRVPIRFARFIGEQIEISGNTVICKDSKRTVKLSAQWSHETAMVAVAKAMTTGDYYGEKKAA